MKIELPDDVARVVFEALNEDHGLRATLADRLLAASNRRASTDGAHQAALAQERVIAFGRLSAAIARELLSTGVRGRSAPGPGRTP